MGRVRDTMGSWLWAGGEGDREGRCLCYVLANWMVPFTEVGEQKESHV